MKLTYPHTNQATCNMFDYTPDELANRDIGILMDDATRRKYRTFVAAFGESANDNAVRIVEQEVKGKHKHEHTPVNT